MLHLIALPHTRVSEEFVGCAYTSKALKFCRMMRDRHDVVLYAPEGSTRETFETVDVIDDAHRIDTFGADDPGRLPAWPTHEQAEEFNVAAAIALSQRWEPGDLVLLTGGATHSRVKELGPEQAVYCEPGVGYEGILTDFCAFESHAWRHFVYGRRGIENGRWFDTVIPNYFDRREFEPVENPTRDYLAYLGRLIPRKGVTVAVEIAKAAGLPLWIAGAGEGADEGGAGRVVVNVGTPEEMVLQGDIRVLGPVDAEARRVFLGNARALLCPTSYIEPFGGVAVEAMLMGTPAISTDWGAFTETIWPGLTGFRFTTLREGVDAVRRTGDLKAEMIRNMALNRYSLEAVRPRFESWFDRLGTLKGGGWYEMSSPHAKIHA